MSALFNGININSLSFGEPDLLRPREIRRRDAEKSVLWFANISGLQPSTCTSSEPGTTLWASDGSAYPASAGPLEPKSIISAATGPVTVAMRIMGRANSVLHSEVFGIITNFILARKATATTHHRLLTDHLNSVRIYEDWKSTIGVEARLRHIPGRSYYRWMLALAEELPNTCLEYTKGHSKESTVEAIMNAEADHYASGLQKPSVDNPLPDAPIPTFFMDDYTFVSKTLGWIEGDIKALITSLLIRFTARDLEYGKQYRMSRSFYDERPTPTFPYTHAVSAYSASVQLYSRSGQLPTADTLVKRRFATSSLCRLGCAETEDPHHIFSKCSEFKDLRRDTRLEIMRLTERALQIADKDTTLDQFPLLKTAAESFLTDSSTLWPLSRTQFYLGHIPPLGKLLPLDSFNSSILRERVLRNLHSSWHIAAVRLTGRIWGELIGRVARSNGITARKF